MSYLSKIKYGQVVSGTRTFTFDFAYISRDDVKVLVDGEEVEYTYNSDNMITLSSAPLVGSIVEIRRDTNKLNRLVDFVDGSTLTESELDLSATQTFYIVQEALDIAQEAFEAAEAVKAIAEEALEISEDAKEIAERAETKADSVNDKADDAVSKAEDALSKADDALQAANEALDLASGGAASELVQEALDTANDALQAAANAVNEMLALELTVDNLALLVQGNTNSINSLTTRVDDLQDALANIDIGDIGEPAIIDVAGDVVIKPTNDYVDLLPADGSIRLKADYPELGAVIEENSGSVGKYYGTTNKRFVTLEDVPTDAVIEELREFDGVIAALWYVPVEGENVDNATRRISTHKLNGDKLQSYTVTGTFRSDYVKLIVGGKGLYLVIEQWASITNDTAGSTPSDIRRIFKLNTDSGIFVDMGQSHNGALGVVYSPHIDADVLVSGASSTTSNTWVLESNSIVLAANLVNILPNLRPNRIVSTKAGRVFGIFTYASTATDIPQGLYEIHDFGSTSPSLSLVVEIEDLIAEKWGSFQRNTQPILGGADSDILFLFGRTSGSGQNRGYIRFDTRNNSITFVDSGPLQNDSAGGLSINNALLIVNNDSGNPTWDNNPYSLDSRYRYSISAQLLLDDVEGATLIDGFRAGDAVWMTPEHILMAGAPRETGGHVQLLDLEMMTNDKFTVPYMYTGLPGFSYYIKTKSTEGGFSGGIAVPEETAIVLRNDIDNLENNVGNLTTRVTSLEAITQDLQDNSGGSGGDGGTGGDPVDLTEINQAIDALEDSVDTLEGSVGSISPVGWNLAQATDIQAVKDYLEIEEGGGGGPVGDLGTAALADVQEDSTDTTAGRLMAVGAFGLGNAGASTKIVLTDPGILRNGFYSFNASDHADSQLPLPRAEFNGEYSLIVTHSAGRYTQVAIPWGLGRLFTRSGQSVFGLEGWIEVGAASTLETQANFTDSTAGRALTVGAFGLGGVGTNPYTNKHMRLTVGNKANPTGFYVMTSSNAGGTQGFSGSTGGINVSGAEATIIHHVNGYTSTGLQLVVTNGSSQPNRLYFRRSTGSGANDWDRWVALGNYSTALHNEVGSLRIARVDPSKLSSLTLNNQGLYENVQASNLIPCQLNGDDQGGSNTYLSGRWTQVSYCVHDSEDITATIALWRRIA